MRLFGALNLAQVADQAVQVFGKGVHPSVLKDSVVTVNLPKLAEFRGIVLGDKPVVITEPYGVYQGKPVDILVNRAVESYFPVREGEKIPDIEFDDILSARIAFDPDSPTGWVAHLQDRYSRQELLIKMPIPEVLATWSEPDYLPGLARALYLEFHENLNPLARWWHAGTVAQHLVASDLAVQQYTFMTARG